MASFHAESVLSLNPAHIGVINHTSLIIANTVKQSSDVFFVCSRITWIGELKRPNVTRKVNAFIS